MRDRIIKKALYVLKRAHKRLNHHYYQVDELPKVVFVHVPKCGGTSISKAFKNIYNYSYFRSHITQTFEAANIFFETQRRYLNTSLPLDGLGNQIVSGSLLFTAVMNEKRCLTGHICFNDGMICALKDRNYHFVTIIRDPVDRFFSNYFFDFYKEDDFNSTTEDFDVYLKNNMDLGYMYTQYFGGLRTDNNYRSDEALMTAVNNLKKFDVIGRLAEMDLFIKKIESTLGITLQIPKANKNPAPKEKYNEFKNSPENRAMVQEVCQPDLKLVEKIEALGLFAGK